ncbi:AMP-binding protein [Ideonella sp. A 288]|uniref:AMP-binding protein n=1 Tax=Ideonella sp. A 288 TaxID=1962181 RepID=UPI000B4BC7B5|nr:AMP-binding protein [Ideonella sp. A 288]
MTGVDTVHALIERAARQWPQAVYAMDGDGGHALDFATLARRCREVGAWLAHLGASRGDTVSLVMPNGPATLQLLLGAMHGGFAVNPVNLLSQPEQMRYVLGHSDCRVVFASPEWTEPVREALATIERPVTLVTVAPESAVLPLPAVLDLAEPSAPEADAMALLMYTSGTTGVPKGVMLSQANLAANARAISDEHGLGPGDRVLAVLPLYHINAFAVTMLAPLAHGGSLAMPPRFSAARFWPQAVERGCTWINVVPTMISYLLEGEVPPRELLARIRFCRSASSALPPEHLRAFEARFGIGVIETMGLTETVAPSFSNPLDPAQRKLGSVGRASGCEARVIDAQGAPVPDGTTGEIAIRGSNVMRGYYKNDASTAAAFTPDGWLRTGDLGHRDADGFFFVTGRIKELIIKGGENIAPREIDEVLLRHPAVLEAAVVGVPDRHYGQEILACIVLREGATPDEDRLRAFCEQHLGRYKTPKAFRFVRELPRGPSGKVQRLKLLDIAG